jgi:hypothetical protein
MQAVPVVYEVFPVRRLWDDNIAAHIPVDDDDKAGKQVDVVLLADTLVYDNTEVPVVELTVCM